MARKVAPIGPYKCEVSLGSGTFGSVVAARHTVTGSRVAIKVIPKQKVEPEVFQKELDNHQCLDHPNIAKLYESIETEQDKCLVMELVSGGDLFDYIVRHARMKEPEAQRLFKQIAAGVAHCHSCSIAHRDLKPENILLDEHLKVKIIDFGLSARMCADSLLTESCGSLNYAAPELLKKNCSYDGSKVDVWSCGVILYALLCGSLPFDDDDAPTLCKKIRRGKYNVPGYVSSEAQDLIAQMLTVDPTSRISMANVQKHSWFNAADCASNAPSMIPVEVPVNNNFESVATNLLLSQDKLKVTFAELMCSSGCKSSQQLRKMHPIYATRFSSRSYQHRVRSMRAKAH